MKQVEIPDYVDGDITEGGLPGWVKHKYNDALQGVADKAARGMAAVAATGFVKGVLAIGALTLAIGALMGGFGAVSGQLFMNAAGALIPATFEQGLAVGGAQALSFLGHGLGLALLGAGGAAGTAAGIIGRQRGIETEQAKLRAAQREMQIEAEKQRARAPAPAVQPPGREAPAAPEPKWVERMEQAAERMERAAERMHEPKKKTDGDGQGDRSNAEIVFRMKELQRREKRLPDDVMRGG